MRFYICVCILFAERKAYQITVTIRTDNVECQINKTVLHSTTQNCLNIIYDGNANICCWFISASQCGCQLAEFSWTMNESTGARTHGRIDARTPTCLFIYASCHAFYCNFISNWFIELSTLTMLRKRNTRIKVGFRHFLLTFLIKKLFFAAKAFYDRLTESHERSEF